MQQPEAGTSSGGSGTRREELASSGQQQTQQLLATCYQLLEACSIESPTAGQRQQLQEQYLSIAAALRDTLAQCKQLEAHEASLAAAQQNASASGTAGVYVCTACEAWNLQQARVASAALISLVPSIHPGPPPPLPLPSEAQEESDPEVQQLRARAQELHVRLEEKNQLIKAAIDRLRLLLDALAMWDSSRRELAAAVG